MNFAMYMNEPIVYVWIEKEIYEEYQKYKDKKIVAKIYAMPVSQITKIIQKQEKECAN